MQRSHWKNTPLFPSNSPRRTEVLSSPLFWKFGRRFNPPPLTPPPGRGRGIHYARKKGSNTNSFSKCDQIGRKLGIWSNILQRSVKENFVFRAVQALPMQKNSTRFVAAEVGKIFNKFDLTIIEWFDNSRVVLVIADESGFFSHWCKSQFNLQHLPPSWRRTIALNFDYIMIMIMMALTVSDGIP